MVVFCPVVTDNWFYQEGNAMNTVKKLEENQEITTGKGCRVTVPEAPSDEELAEARAALGLSKKPRYRVSQRQTEQLEEKWETEPVTITGS